MKELARATSESACQPTRFGIGLDEGLGVVGAVQVREVGGGERGGGGGGRYDRRSGRRQSGGRKLWYGRRQLLRLAATAMIALVELNCGEVVADDRLSMLENEQRVNAQFTAPLFTAQDVNPDKAVEAIQRNSWYDKEKQGFSTPRIPADPDSPLRHSDWLRKPKAADPAASNTSTGTGADRSWFSRLGRFFGFDSQWLNYVLIAGLGVLLVFVVLRLSHSSLKAWLPGRFRKRGEFKAAKIDMAKVVDLPFEVKSSRHDPLSEAEALMRAGRFDEAIIFLFGYLLLALDQASMIQLQRGKTNRMYLRELKGESNLRPITERAMLAFEDVFFGRYALSRERFMEVWNQLPKFHESIHPQGTLPPPGKVSTS